MIPTSGSDPPHNCISVGRYGEMIYRQQRGSWERKHKKVDENIWEILFNNIWGMIRTIFKVLSCEAHSGGTASREENFCYLRLIISTKGVLGQIVRFMVYEQCQNRFRFQIQRWKGHIPFVVLAKIFHEFDLFIRSLKYWGKNISGKEIDCISLSSVLKKF